MSTSILKSEPHYYRKEFVVLGIEHHPSGIDDDNAYFTRRLMADGNQYYGNYRMEYEKALQDLEARRSN